MNRDEATRRLEAERRRVLAAAEAAEHLTATSLLAMASELAGTDPHTGEAAEETFEHQKDMALEVRLARELAEIDAAIERVADGSYGRCVTCGGPIGDDRLRAVPAARRCIGDQGRYERTRSTVLEVPRR